MNSISGVLIRLFESTLELNNVLVYDMLDDYCMEFAMNERIRELYYECQDKSQSTEQCYQKFGELIVRDCLSIARQQRYNMQFLASNPPQSAAAYDIERNIMNHFGVEG